jgi:hypothetical protein
MQPIPRPFFLAFERVLQNRLSREDLMQAMDESMWEFVSLHLRDPAGRNDKPDSLVRIGAICIHFYRLMSKAGYRPEEAYAEISQACIDFEGKMRPEADPAKCSIADYFLAKNEPALCEAAFCNRCDRRETGCTVMERLRGRPEAEAKAPV